MRHVVIDEGSSQIKVVWLGETGIQEKIIPSRLVEGARIQDGGFFHDGAYTVNGSEYTVAPYFDNPIRTNVQQYQTSEFNRVLVHEALRQAGFGGEDVTIYTTLPISDFFGVKPRNDALINHKRENLKGDVKNLSGHTLANIIDCKVWPEAIPAWLDLLINEYGGAALDVDSSYKIMVIDIGGTTTDLTIIDGSGGLQEFTSLHKGVFNVSESLSSLLMKETNRRKIEPHQIDDALRSNFFSGNDISGLISTACSPVVRDIELEMTKFNSESSNLDAVVYVGGGASLMAKDIAKLYGGKTIVGNDLSIARGILKKLINSGIVSSSYIEAIA